MYSKNIFRKWIFNLAFCLVFISQTNGQLLNGGFQQANTQPAAGAFVIMGAGSTVLNSWFVSGGVVDLHDVAHHNMGITGNHIDLNTNGVIFQDVSCLLPNQCYQLSFMTRVHKLLTAGQAIAEVSVRPFGGIAGPVMLSQQCTLAIPPASIPPAVTNSYTWNWRTFAFRTDGTGRARIQFAGMSSSYPNGGVMIDSVSLISACNESIVATLGTQCNTYTFNVTQNTTTIQNTIWTVDGVVTFNGSPFPIKLTPGTHTICVNYFGINTICVPHTVCCGVACTTIVVPPYQVNKCIYDTTIKCGSNFDLNASGMGNRCCPGTYSESTGWVDVFDNSNVLPLLLDMHVPRTVKKTYTDHVNCKTCEVTVNILIERKEIDGHLWLTNCPCKSYSYADLVSYLNSLGNGCNMTGLNTILIDDQTSGLSSILNATSPPINICAGRTYQIALMTNNGPGCCVFTLNTYCLPSPGLNEEDNLPKFKQWKNFDYLFNKFSELNKNVETNEGNNETKIELIAVPNQTNGLFRIQTKNGETIIYDKVEILNAKGAVIYSKNKMESTDEIDIREQAAGIYFVKVMVGSATITLKVIKE